MRIPLARYGMKEVVLFGGGAALLGALLVVLGLWWLTPVPGFVLLFTLYFFRDPERRVPDGAGVVVAPADGKVVDVRDVEDEEFIGGPATRIDIFLAVYNVHVNRVPLAGRVAWLRRREGPYLNALIPEAGDENRAQCIGFIADEGGFPYLVRQIVGTIARRIVCPAKEGEHYERGERFGMIKFGSRTQISIPKECGFDVAVKVGDVVRGASTVLGRVAAGGGG